MSVHRGDFSGLGFIFYGLWRGRPPFDSNDDFELIDQQLHAAPPPLAPALPPIVDELLAIAPAKHPDDRFPTARDIASALEQGARELG